MRQLRQVQGRIQPLIGGCFISEWRVARKKMYVHGLFEGLSGIYLHECNPHVFLLEVSATSTRRPLQVYEIYETAFGASFVLLRRRQGPSRGDESQGKILFVYYLGLLIMLTVWYRGVFTDGGIWAIVPFHTEFN